MKRDTEKRKESSLKDLTLPLKKTEKATKLVKKEKKKRSLRTDDQNLKGITALAEHDTGQCYSSLMMSPMIQSSERSYDLQAARTAKCRSSLLCSASPDDNCASSPPVSREHVIASPLISFLETYLCLLHDIKGPPNAGTLDWAKNAANLLEQNQSVVESLSSVSSILSPLSRQHALNRLCDIALSLLTTIKNTAAVLALLNGDQREKGSLEIEDVVLDMRLPLAKRFIEMRLWRLVTKLNLALSSSMVDSPPQPCQQQQKSHHDVESNYRDNYATIFAGSYAKDLDTLRKQESFSEAKVNRLLECLEMGKEVVFD